LAKDYGLTNAKAAQEIATQDRGVTIVSDLQAALGDDFAGVWFDEPSGHFKVGAIDAAAGAKAAAVAKRLGVDADLVPVKSTWEDLLDAEKSASERLGAALKPEQWTITLAPAQNAIEVDLASSVSASNRAATSASVREVADVDTCIVEKSQDSLAVPANEGACYWSACDPPLRGGQNIYGPMVPGWTSSCTAGFIAHGNGAGNPYVLTAGHCPWGDPYNSTWYAFSATYGAEAIGPDANYRLDANADSGIIQITSSYWGSWIASEAAVFGMNDTYPVYGTTTTYIGLYECHVGAASDIQCGTDNAIEGVVAVTYSAPIGMVVTLNHLTGNTACSTPGDSGGPWLDNYYASGIDVAGYGCPTGQSWYMPAQREADAMNVHIP